jgi:hypothetical protein
MMTSGPDNQQIKYKRGATIKTGGNDKTGFNDNDILAPV